MGWRLGEIRPINKQAGARPILDEQNGVVALVLLGSEEKNRNAEIVLKARAIIEAAESLEDSHPLVLSLRRLNFFDRLPDKQPT